MQKVKWANLITVSAAFFTLLSIIIYGTWFVSSIERRVAILENDIHQFAQTIKDFQSQQELLNAKQDHSQHRFEDQTNKKLFRLEDKVENLDVYLVPVSEHELKISVMDNVG